MCWAEGSLWKWDVSYGSCGSNEGMATCCDWTLGPADSGRLAKDLRKDSVPVGLLLFGDLYNFRTNTWQGVLQPHFCLRKQKSLHAKQRKRLWSTRTAQEKKQVLAVWMSPRIALEVEEREYIIR